MHCEICGPDFEPVEIETTETNLSTGKVLTYFETFCKECHADDPEAPPTVTADDGDDAGPPNDEGE